MGGRSVRVLRSLAGPLALLVAAAPAAGQEVVDGIAAQVGSEIVLVSEVDRLAAPAEARLAAQGGTEAERAMLHAEILERLIERALIRQVVRRAELEASAAEVDEAIAAIAQENEITLGELRASVESQGMPFEAYRERIRSEIEQNKVLNGMVASRVRIEEDELRALYRKEFADQPTGGTQVHLRHLLVPFDPEDPGSRDAACAEVRSALGRIRAGAPFEDLARELSAVNPKRGGDLGWLHTDHLADWMTPAVRSLSSGQVSDVLETPFGCNLLELVERRDYVPVSYEEARPLLHRQVFGERMGKEYTAFMEELRERTFIERKGMYAEAARLDPGFVDDAPPGVGPGDF